MGLFTKFSAISRKKKLATFHELLKPDESTRILDVGGEINPDGSSTLQFIDTYPWKKNITVVNIDEDHVNRIKQHHPEMDAVVGDACQIPWPDKHFDIAFSNAVIEHVGDYSCQKQMASEMMRVAKKWFVTTPNRWYPFEFHLRLPLVTWLPGDGYLYAGMLVSYNHMRKKYHWFVPKHQHLQLLTPAKFHKCFPTSQIIQQRVTFMPETLIATGSDL
jgi:ubiquinone/menaquinone biosynthesis C-methylase UbiE